MKFAQIATITSFWLSGAALVPVSIQPANAYGVCGLEAEAASFRTKSYLITICLGEASYQMAITYPDGTGYKLIPVQKEGNKFRGADEQHNYMIDSRQLIIGTDGENPIREQVIESKDHTYSQGGQLF